MAAERKAEGVREFSQKHKEKGKQEPSSAQSSVFAKQGIQLKIIFVVM